MKSWRAVTYLFRPQYKRLGIQMLTTIRSKMSEVEVINIFKPYSERKKERQRDRDRERQAERQRQRDRERQRQRPREENHQRFYLVLGFGHI